MSKRFEQICKKWDDYFDWIYQPKFTRPITAAFRDYDLEEWEQVKANRRAYHWAKKAEKEPNEVYA